MTHTWKERLIPVVISVALFFVLTNFGAVGAAFQTLVYLVSPVLYGGLAALILGVLMNAIEKLILKVDTKHRLGERLRATFSLILTLCIIFFVIYILIIILVPRLSAGIQNAISIIDKNSNKILKFWKDIGLDPSGIKKLLDRLDTSSIIGFATDNVKTILRTVFSTASSVSGVLFTFVISAVCCIYILLGRKKLSNQLKRVLFAYMPRKTANNICKTTTLFLETFTHFLSRQCLEALILGTLLTVSMLLFRIPFALVVGTITTVFALLPYVGAYISCVAGAILILLTDPSKVIVFLILFLVIQQIEGNLIYPHIVGKSVGLPAIWTLMAVYVGGQLFGFIGMFMFVPIVSVGYTLLRQNVNERNSEHTAQGNPIPK